VLTTELLLVLPILWVFCFGMVELSMLLMGKQRVQAASRAACRMGTLPASDATVQQQAMKDAAAWALGTVGLVTTYTMQSHVGPYAGDPVVVEIRAPMNAAAPDFLRVIGFSLRGRQLAAQTQMCKQ
jgi:hypothetical protein